MFIAEVLCSSVIHTHHGVVEICVIMGGWGGSSLIPIKGSHDRLNPKS